MRPPQEAEMKIQSREALEQEMRAVARGEMAPPADAGQSSVESAAALMRLLSIAGGCRRR